ncbi:hypothetical protein P389DRAFT_166050 [Cystobasidium minutum MCA 4210]|uniref:uncharacterized protein n=1 Tax=Cystobasidium minutum MCA 4210 TaxID=1397322 RepID=UPI0034CFD0CE|eukprot:jgi/Rhomi1/166050/fgenesh1_kg.1_\
MGFQPDPLLLGYLPPQCQSSFRFPQSMGQAPSPHLHTVQGQAAQYAPTLPGGARRRSSSEALNRSYQTRPDNRASRASPSRETQLYQQATNHGNVGQDAPNRNRQGR